MNAFCILFTDTYDNSDSKINELSNARTLASIPFGGRYRLIDFMLSSLVGARVGDIGIIKHRTNKKQVRLPDGSRRLGKRLGFEPQKRRA